VLCVYLTQKLAAIALNGNESTEERFGVIRLSCFNRSFIGAYSSFGSVSIFCGPKLLSN
jgi:hypothetical protein